MFLQKVDLECLPARYQNHKATKSSYEVSGMKDSSLSDTAARGEIHLRFSLEPGFFQQDEATGHDNKKLGTVYEFPENFGLKSRVYDTDTALRETLDNPTDWERFDYKLRQMNKIAAEHNTEFVVLYAARHGQGYHNIAEEKVGTYNWENPSELSKVPICFLPQFEDARLTPVGEDQADTISRILSDLIQTQHLPPPTAYYTSPLHRACSTALRTWGPVHQAHPLRTPFNPIIHELLREQMYPHNCNKRSPIPTIKSNFPTFSVEPDSLGPSPDLDTLFSCSSREPDQQVTDRASLALSDILLPRLRLLHPDTDTDTDTHANQYISLTSHAGFLSGLFRSLGYPQSSIPRFPTGIIFPLLIKVEVVFSPRPVHPRSLIGYGPAVVSEKTNDAIVKKDHASRAKDVELKGKDLDTVMREIFDSEGYERVKEETRLGRWT